MNETHLAGSYDAEGWIASNLCPGCYARHPPGMIRRSACRKCRQRLFVNLKCALAFLALSKAFDTTCFPEYIFFTSTAVGGDSEHVDHTKKLRQAWRWRLPQTLTSRTTSNCTQVILESALTSSKDEQSRLYVSVHHLTECHGRLDRK